MNETFASVHRPSSIVHRASCRDNLLGGVSSNNGFTAPAPAPVSKPGLDGLDAFSFQGFKKDLDGGGMLGGGGGQSQTQQQQPQQQPVYNNVPLNQIPPKGKVTYSLTKPFAPLCYDHVFMYVSTAL